MTDWPEAGGGVETYLTLIARGLREAGDEVRLLTSRVGGGRAVADYVAFGSRQAALQSVLQIANPAAGRTIRRAIAEFAPNVVHVSMFEMHLSPSVLAALRGVPVVLNVVYYKPICPNALKLLPDDSRCTVPQGVVCWRGGCTSLPHWLRDRPRYARIGREIRKVAVVVACSRWLQAELKTAGIDSLTTDFPVDAPSHDFRRTPAADPLFVYAGRLSREKGLPTLLHAMARGRSQGVAARLRIVGEGPLRPTLEGLTAELGLSGVVEFTGWVPLERMETQLADAWALAAPSLWAEPLGLTALEAIVHGVPVIASVTGGLAETVENGVSGLLFPNGDVGALATCLREVASGRVLAGGVPNEIVDRVTARHDVGRHVAWLRALFARVAA